MKRLKGILALIVAARMMLSIFTIGGGSGSSKISVSVDSGNAVISEISTQAINAAVNTSANAGKNDTSLVIENTVSSTLNDNQKNAINGLKMGAEKSVAQTFSAYVTSGNEKITNFKIPSGKKSEHYHVYSLPEAGEPAKCATWVENGVIYFRL